MDVYDAIKKPMKGFRADFAHVPGENNELDSVALKEPKHLFIKDLRVGVGFTTQMNGGNAGSLGPEERLRISVVAHHHQGISVKATALAGINDRLHVASTMR